MAGSGWNPKPEKDRYSDSPSPTDETARAASRYLILVVEDNLADVYLIRDVIKTAGLDAALCIVPDGEKATKFVDEADADTKARCPDLVILDINLPKKSGGEVLRHLRGSKRCASVPVIVASTSDAKRDRDELMRLGATRYFAKPSEYAAFLKLADVIQELLPA